MRISITAQKWLKGVHLFFACLWVGGATTLVFSALMVTASAGGELYGIHRMQRFVDDFMVIPGAMGCLLTGLLYSLLTPWGFFRHGWVTVKWVVCVGGVLFGTFFLGPWLNSLGPIAHELGMDALSDPVYRTNRHLNLLWGSVQTGSLVIAVFLSALKPWKNWRS